MTELNLCKYFRNSLTQWFNRTHETGSRSRQHGKTVSSELSQCLLNSESEACCPCGSAGESKFQATGILHSDLLIAGVCFYVVFLWLLFVEIYNTVPWYRCCKWKGWLTQFLHFNFIFIVISWITWTTTTNTKTHTNWQSPVCHACAPTRQWFLTWSYTVNIQYDVTLWRVGGK